MANNVSWQKSYCPCLYYHSLLSSGIILWKQILKKCRGGRSSVLSELYVCSSVFLHSASLNAINKICVASEPKPRAFKRIPKTNQKVRRTSSRHLLRCCHHHPLLFWSVSFFVFLDLFIYLSSNKMIRHEIDVSAVCTSPKVWVTDMLEEPKVKMKNEIVCCSLLFFPRCYQRHNTWVWVMSHPKQFFSNEEIYFF